MIRKITFKNSSISSVQIDTDAPLQIEAKDNLNVVANMTLTPKGDNLDKNLFILDGDFSNSSIDVKSSCTLQSNPSFLCATPITLDTTTSDTIVLIGDFQGSAGVKALTPATVVSGTSVQLENLNIVVEYKEPNQSNLNIVGDFTFCTTYINSPSSINLDGNIGEILVENNVLGATLNLVPGSIVDDMKVKSKILVTGDKPSIDNLLNNTTEGLDNIIVLYNTFVVDFVSGKGLIPLEITSIGDYIISCTVMDETIEHPVTASVQIQII